MALSERLCLGIENALNGSQDAGLEHRYYIQVLQVGSGVLVVSFARERRWRLGLWLSP